MCVAAAALPMIGTIASAAGTAVSAIGQLQAGAQANRIAQNNARQMERAGQYKARQVRRKVEYTNALTQVQGSAAGLGLGGNLLDIMADNAWQGEVDAFNEVRAANSGANVQREEGKAAQSRAMFGAVGSIIGGVANYANRNVPPGQFLRTA